MSRACALLLTPILLLALLAATPAVAAGPGTGTAAISPSSDVQAGAKGTWSVTYTAAEKFKDGTLVLTIPAGWTPPQISNAANAGYITVTTNEPGGTPAPSVIGNVVTVAVDTLTNPNTITIVYGDNSGGANPNARATAPGVLNTYEFAVQSHTSAGPPGAIVSSPSLNVTVAPPSRLDIIPGDTTVTAGDFASYVVRVVDEFDNKTPVSENRTVLVFPSNSFYLPSNHSTPISQFTIPTGKDSVRVDFRTTVATTVAPIDIAMFTSSGAPSLGDVATVSVVPATLSTSVSTISAMSPVTADGADPCQVTVTARDQYGNALPGAAVTLDVTGSALKTDPAGATGLDGVAQGIVTNTVAEDVTVTGNINGQPLTTNDVISFVAGSVDADSSMIASSPSSVVANGIATSTITVTARDNNGNPIAGLGVTLGVNPPGNGAVLQQPGGVTNASGQITGTLSSAKTGDRVVSATIGGGVLVSGTTTVSFTPGPLASFTWSGIDGNGTAGVSESATLTAFDAQNNIKTNYAGAVTLSTTATGSITWSAPTGNGSLIGSTYTFDPADNGVVNLLVTNTKSETYSLGAQDGAVSQASGNVIVAAAAPDSIAIVAGNGQATTVDTPVSTPPRVVVFDEFSNPISGASVTFTATVGGGSVDVISGGGPDNTGTTAGNGEVDCDVWTLGTTAGPNTLRAEITVAPSNFVDFDATGDPDVGSQIAITPASSNITVGTTRPVTATLRDVHNNLVSGERVDIFIQSPQDGTLSNDGANPSTQVTTTSRWALTNAQGEVSVIYNAPVTASVSDAIDAFTTLVPQGSVTDAVYTTVASGATGLRITFTGGASALAGDGFPILIEAIDGGNNVDAGFGGAIDLSAEAGSNILFSLSDFGATITQVTLSTGTATVYGKGEKAGDWDVTVSGGGLTSDTDPITITDDGVIDHYTLIAPGAAVAGQSFNVTVTARDQFENRVMGATNAVNLSARQAADSTQFATSTLSTLQGTLVAGQVVVPESYNVAESIRIRASAASKEGFSGTIVVGTGSAKRIVKVSGDATGVIAGAGQVLTAQVLDADDNPVNGATVNFNITAGGGNLSAPSAVSAGNGEASVTLTTGTFVALNRVTATINDGNPPADEQVAFVIETIAGPITHYVVTTEHPQFEAGESIGVTAVAKDANENTVTQDNLTVVTMSSTSADVGFTPLSGPMTAGIFATSMVDTTAENGITVTASSNAGANTGTSAALTVTNAGAHRVVKISGDASGVTAGAQQSLQVEVTDIYGNTVAGTPVTYTIDGASVPGGSITGGVDGIVTTNSVGRATATLNTSSTVGINLADAKIFDGVPPGREKVQFSVSTVAGGIAYYVVTTNVAQQVAGQPVTVDIDAYDGADNLVDDTGTQVTLDLFPGSGPIWGQNPVSLVNGAASTTLQVNQVQVYNVRARTVGDLGTEGISAPVNIIPAAPFGVITALATPDTITANGAATSNIISGVIRDQLLNQVATGEMITIATNNGGFPVTPDDDPVTPGKQRAVAANGTIAFDLRSSTSPGTASVTINSVNGSATGNVNVEFAEVPAFTAAAPTPPTVIAGQSYGISVPVTNTSATRANLLTTTKLQFTDGSHPFAANLSAAKSIGPGELAVLTFASTLVDANMIPAFYQPTIQFSGTDEYGATVSSSSPLPPNSMLVTAIQIVGISAPPTVIRGKTGTVLVTVNNPGTAPATVNSISLDFDPMNGTYLVLPSPDVPFAIDPGTSHGFLVPVDVDAASATGPDSIDASVSATVNGTPVTDMSVAPLQKGYWNVIAGAELVYLASSLSPITVTQGGQYSFQIGVHNNGDATVTLLASQTNLTFTDGVRTYTANLTQDEAIAGGANRTLTFQSTAVNPAMTPGNKTVTINVSGLENGIPYLAAVIAGDPVLVQTPPSVATSGADHLKPDQVSTNSSVSFTVTMANSGGATAILNPATTTLSFPGYTATLDPTGNTTLPPGVTLLTFVSTPVTVAANTYFPTVHLEGTQNGQAYTPTNIALTDGVVVEAAPDVAINAILTSQPAITRDQVTPITVKMVVENNGGATVNFVDASIRFILGGVDRTSQFTDTDVPTGFGPLTGGEVDTVYFTIGDDNAGAMSPGIMTIEGDLEVDDPSTVPPILADTDLGGKGSLLVQTPAVFTVFDVIPSQSTVTQNQTQPITMRVPMRNNGQSDATVDLSGSGATLLFVPAPGWNWSNAVLAGGGNVLSGGETDTLLFSVTPSGSTLGPAAVDAAFSGTELNSGRLVSGTSSGLGLGNVTVQSAGTVVVNAVTASRPVLTNGANVAYTLTLDVENTGQADVDLGLLINLPTNLVVSFVGASAAPDIIPPEVLVGGGTVLGGGESDQLVVAVLGTGTYFSPGLKSITASLSGRELNTNETRSGNNATNVTVQQPPDVNYVSLSPDTVSQGTNETFSVSVTNPVASGATIVLDRTSTRLRFNGGLFEVALQPASPDNVPALATVGLVFQPGDVANAPLGPQADAEIELHWSENGRDSSKTIPIPAPDLVVQAAPALSIVEVRPSQSTVTQGQGGWTITMVLNNSGGAAVDLNLGTTLLTLTRLGTGANVTTEYVITPPTGLKSAGGSRLAGNNTTDSLVFDVVSAGSTVGSIIASGVVNGTVVNSSQPVSDSGGTGTFALQTPANLQILSIVPSQTTATTNQIGQYTIAMTVRNNGGAAVDLNLTSPATSLQFTGSAVWVTPVQPALAGGGVTLSGGETDVVTFTVNTTGDTQGATTIGGVVAGTETNRSTAVGDDTVSGGTGTINLQSPAVIVFNSVVPSRTTVTGNTPVPWEVLASITNTGASAATLQLPNGLTATIADATGGNTFAPVTQLEGGGVQLVGGASGSLRIVFNSGTGTFSSLGTKTIDLGIDATEDNSGRQFNIPNSTASIAVQSPPSLVYELNSLNPSTVSLGSVVAFHVNVTNNGPNAATATLDRGQTRLHFNSGGYSAFLDLTSNVTIAAGQTQELIFEGKLIDPLLPNPTYDVTVDLFYAHNSNSGNTQALIPSGLSIVSPGDLSITQISVSPVPAQVTAGQTTPWTVTMTVQNTGAEGVAVDLGNTTISFDLPGGGSDSTVGIAAPTMPAGNVIYDEPKEVVFDINPTGTATGAITINGSVEGQNLVTSALLSDDTFDGGRGNITVLAPATINVVRTTTLPATVTAGQTTQWTVRTVLQNSGGADVAIDLANTNLTFSGGGPWSALEPTLAGGGNVLEGNSVDSLIFQIPSTGSAGIWRIDTDVHWIDINSSVVDSVSTVSSGGFGSITVQTPPQLRLAVTSITAPNAPNVNTGQAFQITAQVENTGQATASTVGVALESNGISVVGNTPGMIPTIAGGGTESFIFNVTAQATPTTETFASLITGAADANSGETGLPVINPALDATEDALIQQPALLVVSNTRPSQASVTRGQSTPWFITVDVRNDGQADAELAAPAATDIHFYIAGAPKMDYVVVPPTTFYSGASGWTLPGGATDSLAYTVIATGATTGTVDIDVAVDGVDGNDPTMAIADTDSGVVQVDASAGLVILSTVADSLVFNHATANRDTVNTNYSYQMLVSVENTGETVDSVAVSLAKDDGSTVTPTSLIKQSLVSGESKVFAFNVTSPGAPTTLETFTSTIIEAKSRNSGLDVIPLPPVDATQQMVARTPANLSLALSITDPPGATNGTVSAGQVFTMTAVVTNAGQAGITGTRDITLTPPSNFIVSEPLTRGFGIDQAIDWTVTAPGSLATYAFACSISDVPNDKNTDADANVSQLVDNQLVTVSGGGALANPTLAITLPAGATDDTLSTEQSFVVRAAVTPSVDAIKVVSSLQVPSDYRLTGGGTDRQLGPGDGSEKSVTYNLIAPLTAQSGDTLRVNFTGEDINTNAPLDTTQFIVLETVTRASLQLSASVTAPQDAIDRSVSISTPFTVAATVANNGTAGVTGTAILRISVPSGYILNSPTDQNFVVGTSVMWNVTADSLPSGPDDITFNIQTVPQDENSGNTALVSVQQATIAMVTEGAAVAVRNVTSEQGIDNKVVPGGTKDVAVLAFQMRYGVSDTSAASAHVDTLAVTLLDGDGTLLTAGAVNGTVSRLAIDLGGAQVYETTNTNQNPVVVIIPSPDAAGLISPGDSLLATVSLDVRGTPSAGEIRAQVRSRGIRIRDVNSGKYFGIVDDNTGQALNGQITSQTLVILSNKFEEYVHNYPNPFRAGSQVTKITYFLDVPATVHMKIYTITGDLVYGRTMLGGAVGGTAGPHEAEWDGRNGSGEVVRNGIYVCVVTAGSQSAKFRIAVAK